MGTENRVRNLHLFIWTGIAEYWRDRTLNRDNREWIGCGLLKLKKAPQDELKRLIKVHCRFQKGSLWKLIRGSTILFHKLGHNKPRNEIHYSSFRLKMVKRGIIGSIKGLVTISIDYRLTTYHIAALGRCTPSEVKPGFFFFCFNLLLQRSNNS